MPPVESIEDLHIIIVDDDQLVRDFAVHTIEYGTNQKVVTFDSGFRAWQFIQQTPHDVDIIIADANIPDMSGMELLRHVKKDFPDKKFIITTGDPSLETEASQLGADAFLSKPYGIDDLFAIVQQFFSATTQSQPTKVALFPKNDETQTADHE